MLKFLFSLANSSDVMSILEGSGQVLVGKWVLGMGDSGWNMGQANGRRLIWKTR